MLDVYKRQTIQTDAYYVAEGLMQNALIPISEAVAVSFLPIYITIKEKNKEEAHKFTSRTITDIFLLALVLSGILYVVAPMPVSYTHLVQTCLHIQIPVSKMLQQILFPIICTLHLLKRYSLMA